MEAAQTTFISSTFWTERIGPTAGLKTLEVMERTRSWDQITQMGKVIGEGWRKLAAKHELEIQVTGLPSLICFSFASQNHLAYKTLITQEMLAQGYLATTSVYVCTEHTKEVVDTYLETLDPIFGMIRACEEGQEVLPLLKSPICHSGFKRLN
jgi:glutamate-1-semialdehyde 2,1-aminomutase